MSQVSVKPAATGRYTHRYNPVSVLSLDFGDLVASRCVEVEKSDDWKFQKVKGTLRLAPQVFPAYGKNTLKSAAFFVPTSQLLESYDQWRNNNKTWKGKVVRVPHFIHHYINDMFFTYQSPNATWQLCTKVGSSANNDTYKSLTQSTPPVHVDFVHYDIINGLWEYFALTPTGKRFYKVLKMLGYDFASYNSAGATSAEILQSGSTPLNAFKLLSYAKVYVDYFLNPHFYNSNPLVAFLTAVHDNEDYQVSPYNYANGIIDAATLFEILKSIVVPYEHNMYLDSWNSPNNPTGVAPDSLMFDVNQTGIIGPKVPIASYKAGSVDTPAQEFVVNSSETSYLNNLVGGSGSNNSPLQALSVWGQNFLNSVFQFARRNGLFGSKPVQQFFARFGIKDADWNTHFASKLYEGVSEIDYSAVLSQSDTEVSSGGTSTGKTLGSYAGFGVSGLNFGFSYKASDPGYIIVLHWLQITPLLVHGTDPDNLRIEPLDWYTPEFDGKGIRAIPQMEVSIDRGTRVTTSNDKAVFGFTDIYEEYRNMRDCVVGDFVVDDNVKNFVFARDLSWFREMTGNSIQSAIKPQTDAIQYMTRVGVRGDQTDPFQFGPTLGDRFYLYVNYEITAQRNISSKSSALELNGEGELKIQLGGTQLR